jgi:hypothetical protein
MREMILFNLRVHGVRYAALIGDIAKEVEAV